MNSKPKMKSKKSINGASNPSLSLSTLGET